jgi:selenocysteine-specific elongation factor
LRLAELAALRVPDRAQRLNCMLEIQGLDLDRLAVHWNCNRLAETLPPDSRLVHAGNANWAFSGPHWRSLQEKLRTDLAGFHEQFPDELGPDAARARRMFLPRLSAAAFSALVDELLSNGTLHRSGSWLHLPTHRISLTPDEEALYQSILPRLKEAAFDPPWVRDLARHAGRDETVIRRLLQKLARQGKLYQVVRDLFYLPETVVRLATVVQELENGTGETRAAEFRDRSGLGRKRAIQVLEFFDRVGYTRRVRESHRLRNPELFASSAQNV